MNVIVMNAFERLIRRALQQIDPNRALEGIIDEIVHLINIPGRLAYQRRLRVPQHAMPRFRPEVFWEWLPGHWARNQSTWRFYADEAVPSLDAWTRVQRDNPYLSIFLTRAPKPHRDLFHFPGN